MQVIFYFINFTTRMCIREKDEQKKRNDKINRELSVVKHRAYKEKKILLLGVLLIPHIHLYTQCNTWILLQI